MTDEPKTSILSEFAEGFARGFAEAMNPYRHSSPTHKDAIERAAVPIMADGLGICDLDLAREFIVSDEQIDRAAAAELRWQSDRSGGWISYAPWADQPVAVKAETQSRLRTILEAAGGLSADDRYRAGQRAAYAHAAEIAREQPFYPDTHTGSRQQWVKDRIVEKIIAAAEHEPEGLAP